MKTMPEQPFYKFPSTPYLFCPSASLSRQDKVLSEIEAQVFFDNNVIVEEKMDGANLGISFSEDGIIQLQNRGHFITYPYLGQWKPLDSWLNRIIDRLFDVLLDRYILFGEWCYLTHSIYYNSLPDWFLAFDVFDKINEEYLSIRLRNQIAEQIGISVVPHLYSGIFSTDMLDKYLSKSAYGEEQCEGLYFRIDSSDYLLHRAKYVRKNFVQANDIHWTKQETRKNGLRDVKHNSL